jgi:hypothetical protein
MAMSQQAGSEMLIQMRQCDAGRWHVHQVGAGEALASFDDMEAAVDYASDYAQTNQGRIVQFVE